MEIQEIHWKSGKSREILLEIQYPTESEILDGFPGFPGFQADQLQQPGKIIKIPVTKNLKLLILT